MGPSWYWLELLNLNLMPVIMIIPNSVSSSKERATVWPKSFYNSCTTCTLIHTIFLDTSVFKIGILTYI